MTPGHQSPNLPTPTPYCMACVGVCWMRLFSNAGMHVGNTRFGECMGVR